MTPPLESRLAILEQELAAMSAELKAIRAELQAGRADITAGAKAVPREPSAAGPKRPSHPRAAPVSRQLSSQDVERMLGRYGMLAIAVLAAVAAVGTFLSWAISRGYLRLGPGARVLTGLAFAAGVGIWGIRLRRTERSFGSSVVGLALVIVQVCAYAAGPGFHLVPIWVAFANATVISWAIAMFAHRENDESLWCVGFGGAAIAPFVTSDGHGNVYALGAYGALSLLSACFAISHRRWPVAWRVFYLASALFVIGGAIQSRAEGLGAFLVVFALPYVIALGGVLPFAPPSRKRGALRWLGSLGMLVTGAANATSHSDAWVITGAFVAALCLWLVLVDRLADVPQSSILVGTRDRGVALDWIDAALIPLVLALQAGDVIDAVANVAVVALPAAVACAALAWRRGVSALRDAAAFAATVLAINGVEHLPLESPGVRISALVALALVTLELHRMRPSRTWVAMGGILLLSAAALSAAILLDRPPYRSTPFSTEPSAVALVVTVGLVIVARFWKSLRVATRAAMGERPEWTFARELQLLVRTVSLAPWVWAFIWVAIELAMAFSPSASILLLVTYFAATGVACVAVGRARHAPRLRQVGLGLAVVSACTAVYGASTYFDFAARIAAYLVTSAFLLGIAYWYRRPGSAAATA